MSKSFAKVKSPIRLFSKKQLQNKTKNTSKQKQRMSRYLKSYCPPPPFYSSTPFLSALLVTASDFKIVVYFFKQWLGK